MLWMSGWSWKSGMPSDWILRRMASREGLREVRFWGWERLFVKIERIQRMRSKF